MNWLTNSILPKIRSIVGAKDVPDNLWQKCAGCEGMLSLIQMPRTTIAVQMVKDAGLPYFVLLTDPTTGGVSASFAMLGDIHISEPGAMIGFAGKRVIEETIREQLPPGFQTAEYLKEHGMVDMVVPRKELRDTIIRLLDILMRKDRTAKISGTPPQTSKTGTPSSGRGIFTADSFSAPKTKLKAAANQDKPVVKAVKK